MKQQIYHWRSVQTLVKISLVVFILAVMIFPAMQPALAATCTQYHTVKRGENLYRIGLQYGVSWKVLAEINDLDNPRIIYPGQKLCISTSGSPTNPPVKDKIPTFVILSVVRDQSVTIKTNNFPANETFDVRMGAMGTRGVNGIKVDQISSGSGDELTLTFNIPASLQGSQQIAIRLESPGSGYYSFNWFHNRTAK